MACGRSQESARTLKDRASLLPLMRFDRLLNLPFHGVEVEACWGLHWRIIDGGLRQFGNFLLNNHEPPEFATHEIVHVASASIVQAFAAGDRRSLKRVLADVDGSWHVGRILFARPPVWLLEELEFEVIHAKGTEMRAGKIEDLMASGGALAGQKIHLIVAVEVVLVAAAFQRHALEKLVGNVGISRRSRQRREPVEPREDSILDRTRLDAARPADDARHAEAAFIAGAFGGLERCHT